MDCSICFNAITKETGLVTLSCEHSFHLRCINHWFWNQYLKDLTESCPCCRNTGADMDRCFFEEINVEEEEDDDEDDEEEEQQQQEVALDQNDYDLANMILTGEWRMERLESEQWIIQPASSIAFESLRALFGPLNQLELEEEEEKVVQNLVGRACGILRT